MLTETGAEREGHGAAVAGAPPVAVGAVGGSGTRVVARLLGEHGFALGDDLNATRDNLWFTLLFKRLDVLVETPARFAALVRAFQARMTGVRLGAAAAALVHGLADRPRPTYDGAWLTARAESFLAPPAATPPPARWGWKEPNTHVVIDRLLSLVPELRYVHVMRNGLDMAFSANRNQLALWGPVFLGRAVEQGPSDCLAYWCAVHRRMRRLATEFPGRVFFLDFDRLCRDPRSAGQELLDFAGIDRRAQRLDPLAAELRPPASTGRFRAVSHPFTAADLEHVASWGYPVR